MQFPLTIASLDRFASPGDGSGHSWCYRTYVFTESMRPKADSVGAGGYRHRQRFVFFSRAVASVSSSFLLANLVSLAEQLDQLVLDYLQLDDSEVRETVALNEEAAKSDRTSQGLHHLNAASPLSSARRLALTVYSHRYVLNSRRSLRLVAEGGNTSTGGEERAGTKSKSRYGRSVSASPVSFRSQLMLTR